MKLIRKASVWTVGILGLFSASSALVHAAQTTGDQPTTQGPSESVIVNGAVIESLPAEDQDQLQDSYEMLQEKYGDTFNQLTLEIQDGQLRVIGLSPNATAMGRGSPSSA